MHHLQTSGFLISPKSITTPTPAITYIGKHYTSKSISNTPNRLAALMSTHFHYISAPYLSPSKLSNILGSSTYALSHHSSYTPLSYQHLITYHHQYIHPDHRLRTSFARAMAYAAQPWHLTGPHFHPHGASRPHVFVDASARDCMIGCVFPMGHQWMVYSQQLPSRIRKLPLEQRQQVAELYGLLIALHLSHRHHITSPVIVMDNAGAIFTTIKGSTTIFPPHRHRVLSSIQQYTLKHHLLYFLAYTPSPFMPADIPSHQYHPLQPATPSILSRLATLDNFPGLIAYDHPHFDILTQLPQDTSSGAWATPPSLRQLLRHNPHSAPSFDLYAHPHSAMAPFYCTHATPVTPDTFTRTLHTGERHTFWFQPPYGLLDQATSLLIPHLPDISGWALLPSPFVRDFVSRVQNGNQTHVCVSAPMCVHYIPPGTSPGPGSFQAPEFNSVLCHFGEHCVCEWLFHNIFPFQHFC